MKPDPQLVAATWAQCKAELDRLKFAEDKLVGWSPEKWATQGKTIQETRVKILAIMAKLAQGDEDVAKTSWERITE